MRTFPDALPLNLQLSWSPVSKVTRGRFSSNRLRGKKERGQSPFPLITSSQRVEHTAKHLTAALGSTGPRTDWQHPTPPDRGQGIPGEILLPRPIGPRSFPATSSVPRGGSGWEPRAEGVKWDIQKGEG